MQGYINEVQTANVLEYIRSHKEATVAKLAIEVQKKKHMDKDFVIAPYTFLLHSYENSTTNNIF